MKFLKTILSVFFEISNKTEQNEFSKSFYYALIILYYLQMIGYTFFIEDLDALANYLSYYIIYICKSCNIIFFLKDMTSNQVFYVFFYYVQTLIIFEYFFLAFLAIMKMHNENNYRKVLYKMRFFLGFLNLYYKCFLWVVFLPLMDLNINFILCNSKTLKGILCKNDIYILVFGILGIILCILTAIRIICFYLKTEFGCVNILKRNFRFLYFIKLLTKFLFILFYYVKGYEYLFYLFLHTNGILALYSGFFKYPFENFYISFVFSFFSLTFESLAILSTFSYYTEIVRYEEIVFIILIMLPFLFAFSQKSYFLRLEHLFYMDVHNPKIKPIQLLLYFENIFNLFKSHKLSDIFFLNGVFSKHASMCKNPTCKLFHQNKSLNFSMNTLEYIESWFHMGFTSLNQIESRSSNEFFLLNYCSFLEKFLHKQSFSYYALKSFIHKDDDNKTSFFFQYFSRYIQHNLRKKLLAPSSQNESSDANILNLKNFIQYQEISSKYLSRFTDVLKAKQAIYEHLNEGYKNLDIFFNDSKKFLYILEKFQHDFDSELPKLRKSYLLTKFKSLFYYVVLNDYLEFMRLEKKLLEIKNSEKIRKHLIDSHDFISGEMILLTASLLGETGDLRGSNSKKIADFFGYEQLEFQSIHKVENLIPLILAKSHGLFTKHFLQNSSTKSFFANSRNSFCLNKNMFLFQTTLVFTFNFSNDFQNDFCLTVALKKIKDYDSRYALCHMNGIVSCVSEFFLAEFMSIDWRSYYEKTNIFYFFPDLLKILNNFKTLKSNDFNATILKNEILDVYFPNNLNILKSFPDLTGSIDDEFKLKEFIKNRMNNFIKEISLISVFYEKYEIPDVKILEVLIIKVHKIDSKELKSLYTPNNKSLVSQKIMAITTDNNNDNEDDENNNIDQELIIEKNTQFLNLDLLDNDKHDPFSGTLARANKKPEVLSSPAEFKTNLRSEDIIEEVCPVESEIFNSHKNLKAKTETTTKITKEAIKENSVPQDDDNFKTSNMEASPINDQKENISIGSMSKDEKNYGAKLIKNFITELRYPKLLKKIFIIFTAQVVLLFVLNFVSYFMIKNEMNKFIDYSEKMLVPDMITISYSYIIESENLLLLMSSGYLTEDIDVLHDLIIELDGHSFDNLNIFLENMKDPSFVDYFNEGFPVYYFSQNSSSTQIINFKDFLNVVNQKINVQIKNNRTLFSEIYDFYSNNFKTIIEYSNMYMNFFLQKAIDIRDQQEQFYLMISLIGLFLSILLILLNLPFLVQYLRLLERTLLIIARMDQNECKLTLEYNRYLMNLMNNKSEGYLKFYPDQNFEENIQSTISKNNKKTFVTHANQVINSKKNLSSKITNSHLSKKPLFILNGLILSLICFYYTLALIYRSQFNFLMSTSINTNIFLSNYIESSDLAYSIELLLINNIFLNGDVLPNQTYQILKNKNDYDFYKNTYLVNLNKLSTFLEHLSDITDNSNFDSNITSLIRECFYDDVCPYIEDEVGCHHYHIYHYGFGLNGFWQNFLKESKERLLLLTNFSNNDNDREQFRNVYTNNIMYEKLIDIHIFDHRNVDLFDRFALLQLSITNELLLDILLIFIIGSGGCTAILLIINIWMFLKIKNNIILFRKILILIPNSKLKEENTVYLIKKLNEL